MLILTLSLLIIILNYLNILIPIPFYSYPIYLIINLKVHSFATYSYISITILHYRTFIQQIKCNISIDNIHNRI